MTHRPYPSYKDSGIEWLGEVPEHWGVKRLGFLTNRIGSGKTPSGGAEVYGTDGVLFIRSQNVYDDGLRLDDVVYISEQIDEEMKWSRVQSGDVLLNITGASLGRTCLVPDDFCPANVNQHVCVIRLNSQDQRFFVAQAMTSISIKTQIDAIQNGAAREGLNFEQISKITMPLPPLPEQQAIAAFLDRETAKIDGLVAEQERLIELLTEKRSAVISHAVTRGLDPSVPLKDSGVEWLGQVPVHWEVKRLADVAGFQSGKAHEPFVDDGGEFICVNSRFVSTEGESRKYCTVNLSPTKKGDILMVMSDLPNGRALAKAYYVKDEPNNLAVNQRVCIITAGARDSRYLYHLLNRNSLFLSYDDGINQTHLSTATFTKFPTLTPPLPEQQAIAAYLDEQTARFDALMAEARRGIELLKERRTALISAAVTGKIDVRKAV